MITGLRKITFTNTLLVLALVATPALADLSGADKNSELGTAAKAVKAGDYENAIGLLQKVVEDEPRNADAWNLLGYSHRKLRDYEQALTYYQKALTIEPKHRGVNEYLGELYLETGDLKSAEERLEVLDGACFFTCREYRELKKAIEKYKAG